jgi:DNA ligase-1
MTRILLKNLRCGVTATTVNKVWPGLVPHFGVQLANVLKGEPEKYPVIVDPKIDGLRLVAIKNSGRVRLFTRKGHEVETLPWIVEALSKGDYDNTVLDGEIMGASWNETQSVVASTKDIKEGDLKLNVFDCISLDIWTSQGESAGAQERRLQASDIVKKGVRSEHIQAVPWTLAYTDSEIRLQYEEFLRGGYEGAMVKCPNAPYEFKRSNAVLKVKPRETFTGVVVGYERGKGKYEGSIGALVVQVNGVESSVGTGMTDALRRQIAEDPDSYVGKFVELESQELTADGKLRFPVWKGFRTEVDL